MPIELLRELAERRLPCWIEDSAALDKLRLLHAAELVVMIVASNPQPATPGDLGFRAHVLAITKKGRLVLASRSLVSLNAPFTQSLPEGTDE